MGFFSSILMAPLLPVRGVAWIAEQIETEANRILAEENNPEKALQVLETAHKQGEITDEEFQQLEEEILQQLMQERQIVIREGGPE
jgi:uncharacterized membrane protein